MSRFNVAENGHAINIIPPVDVNGGKASDIFSMKDADHVSIGLFVGVSAGTLTVTLDACDDFSATATSAMAFNVYKEETAAGDTLGARTAVAAAGMTISGNDNIMYWIEVDAEELPAGYPNLRLTLSDPSASVIASAVAIQSGLAYQGATTRTQIA